MKVNKKTFRNNDSIHITAIAEGHSGNLWVGTWNNGLAMLEKSTNTLRSIRPVGDNQFASKMRVRSILPDTEGIFWICTNYGLFRYNVIQNRLSLIVLSPDNPNDNIYSSLKDREGGIWIGTYFQGVYYLSPRARQIECYTSQNEGRNMKGTAISSFHEYKNGLIYVASENGGLSLFDPLAKRVHPLNFDITANNLHALCINSNHLYIGTFSQGLKIVDLNTGSVRNLTKRSHPTLPSNNIFSLYGTEGDHIYIGTDLGCAIYDRSTGALNFISELVGEFIYDIIEDKYGNIWFATYYNGLFRYDRNTMEWKHFINDKEDPTSLTHNKTHKLYIDDSDILWICTEGGGICRYDYENDCFHRLDMTLNGKEVVLSLAYGILSDSKGILWISSNNGLWACEKDGHILRHLTYEDGLQSNQYSFGATLRSSTGSMYFGGVNGFNVINPEDLHDSSTRPIVTARIIYDDKAGNTVSSSTLPDSGEHTLPRNVSSFTIGFECLSYNAPHRNEFAYSIDNNEAWTYTSESSVTLIHFPYGKHTIRVRARNGDGHWSENEVLLVINNLPPIAQSKGAKALYILLSIIIIIIALTLTDRRHEEKSRIKFNEIKAAQEQETYKAKIDFFTQVAHEIKTPATLIKAPLEVILKKKGDDEDKHNLEIIAKNTDRLLNLVNQVLDFKKISNIGHTISIESCDPGYLVRNVTGRFDGKTLGNIDITTTITDSPLRCMIDPEAYTKIISNLMTNAVKHAKSRIDVHLGLHSEKSEQILRLEVYDDGCGIPETDRKRIFESFYQINTSDNPRMSGVGLGLSLVKLLVQKHNGKVYVDETSTNGCRIYVDIPYIVPAESVENSIPEAEEPYESPLTKELHSGANILIVEDTSDMLDFISSVFKDRHTIHKAPNGKKALELMYRQEIDIVISDLVMPVMNGFELLQKIRDNDMFCHIPVIMLSVENALETRIKGLEYGADAYIEKPFSPTHLSATIENLLSRRNAMIKRYTASPLDVENGSIISSLDHNWFNHLTSYINDNIQETDISVEDLANELNMSYSSFQRKLKGLTGLSPVEFVRLIRLKKAAELLNSSKYRVNEVAYMVGFNKPSYFTALFKKQFGVLPKDFKE